MPRRILHESVYRFKNDGTINAGGSVTCKLAGTSTDKDTYNEYALTTALSNPVVLDSNGRSNTGSGEIWLEAGYYDITIKDSDSNAINTINDLTDDVLTSSSGSDGFDFNGSFEATTNDVPDDWTLVPYSGGTIALSTANQGDGQNAMKFTSTGTGGGIIKSIFLPVGRDERKYELSWTMYSSVVDVQNDIQLRFFDKSKTALAGGDAFTSAFTNNSSNPTAWTRKSAVITPPSTALWAQVWLVGCNSADATAGNTHYDNVVLKLASGVSDSISKDGDYTILPSDVADVDKLVVFVDIATAAANVTITLPTPANYKNTSIKVIIDGEDTDYKLIVNKSGATEFYTGYAENDFAEFYSDGTVEIVEDEEVTVFGTLLLTTTDSIATVASENPYAANYDVHNNIGNWFDSVTDHQLESDFKALVEVTYLNMAEPGIVPDLHVAGFPLHDWVGRATNIDPMDSYVGITLNFPGAILFKVYNLTAGPLDMYGTANGDESQVSWRVIKRLRT